MKKNFLTGLAIILPAFLTFLIINFLIKLLTKPFLASTKSFLTWISTKEGWLYLLHSPAILQLISQILILIALFLLLLLIGFLGRLILFNPLIKALDRFAHKIPFANKIYNAVQEIVQNVMWNSSPQFSKVVLVPFPHAKAYSVGFITCDQLPISEEAAKRDLVSVFILGTPNPVMGYMLLCPREKIIPTTLSFEDAVKFIISCGVVYPRSFKKNEV